MLQQPRDEVVPDEATIERLVRAFYERARQDAMLGPIFASHVNDWDEHLRKVSDFWSSVILRSGRYHGRPVPAHVRLDIDAAHFDRWLELFERTARDVCELSVAEEFIERARMIAGSLELAVASHYGVIVALGGRYWKPEC